VVNLGTIYSLGAAPLFVALGRGLFAQQGLQVEVQRTTSAADVLAFLSAGHLDVAAGGLSVPLYNAIARGVPVKIVAPLGIMPEAGERGPVTLVARKDLYDSGALRDVGQLRGRKVAITGLGTDNHWTLAKLLQQHNLRLDDVEIVPMSFGDMLTALRTGNLDAAVMAAPFDVQAEESGAAEVLVANAAPGQMVTVLMFAPDFAQTRADAARRFMIAYQQAIAAIQREGVVTPDKLEIYEQYLGLDQETLRKSRATQFDPDLRVRTNTLLDFQQFLASVRTLAYEAPLTEEQLVDRTFAERALQQAAGR
jgi:NitT/TauT family transport system substrate-binding protein